MMTSPLIAQSCYFEPAPPPAPLAPPAPAPPEPAPPCAAFPAPVPPEFEAGPLLPSPVVWEAPDPVGLASGEDAPNIPHPASAKGKATAARPRKRTAFVAIIEPPRNVPRGSIVMRRSTYEGCSWFVDNMGD
jgi:hypothetical protein